MSFAEVDTVPAGFVKYSLPQAAQIIGCSEIYLNRLVSQGRIPATRDHYRRWVFDDNGLDVAAGVFTRGPGHPPDLALRARIQAAARESYLATARDQTYPLAEASAIIGCSHTRLRYLVNTGEIPARRNDVGHWILDADGIDLARQIVRPQPAANDKPCRTCCQLADLLSSWETATVAELTAVMDLHPGNVRKHLNHLLASHRAIRRLDGSWELTPLGHSWMAEERTASGAEAPVHTDDDIGREARNS